MKEQERRNLRRFVLTVLDIIYETDAIECWLSQEETDKTGFYLSGTSIYDVFTDKKVGSLIVRYEHKID